MKLPIVCATLALFGTMSAGLSAQKAKPQAKGTLAAQQTARAGQNVPLDQLPEAITTAVEKAYPKSTLVSASKIARGTDERYVVTLKATADAQPITVMALPDGTVRTAPAGARGAAAQPGMLAQRKAGGGRGAAAPSQSVVKVDDLPKPVTKVLKETYPKDMIVSATKVPGTVELYQVMLDDPSSTILMRVVVTPDGKIQKR